MADRVKNLDYYMGLPYTMQIKKSGQGYFARIAKLPGCMTWAASFGALEAMIEEALAVWISDALENGDPIPKPRQSFDVPKDEQSVASRETIASKTSPRIYVKALRLFEGDEEAARRWLSSPLPMFGGATPLEFASTDGGAKEVIQTIARLEQGIFS